MSAEPTLEQKITNTIQMHEQASEAQPEPEVRVYEVKTRRKLASGEIKEYTLKNMYVPKKKPGPTKTALK